MDKQEFEAFIDDCVIDLEETIGTSSYSRSAIKKTLKKVALVSNDNAVENSVKWLKKNVNEFVYKSEYSGEVVVDEESLVKAFEDAIDILQ